MSTETAIEPIRIRSYAIRQGRMTVAQKLAREQLWPNYGVDALHVHDWQEIFGNSEPLIVEIGTGMGEVLVDMAATHRRLNFVGIEVYPPGVGALLHKINQQQLTNVRVVALDAWQVLNTMFADQSISALHLFFPDPWPKKRHHKRRIVRHDFIVLCAQKLKSSGYIHIATDWAPYAEHICAEFAQHDALFCDASTDKGIALTERRPSRFSRRGNRLGHDSFDLIFKRAALA